MLQRFFPLVVLFASLLASSATEASIVLYSYRGTSVLIGGGRSEPATHTGALVLDLKSMSATYVGQFTAGKGKGRFTRWETYSIDDATLTQVAGPKGTSTVLALASSPGNRYKGSILHFASATGQDSQLAIRTLGTLEKVTLPKTLAASGFALTADAGGDYLLQSKGVYSFHSAATLAANNAGKSLPQIVSEWEAGFVAKNLQAAQAGELPGMASISQTPPPQMITVAGGTLPETSALAGATVQDFLIGKYEVTWDEWKEVRDWARAKGYSDLSNVGFGKSGKHPVTRVSWLDAVKWSNARSEKEGLVPVYELGGAVFRAGRSIPTPNPSSSGYRLPTEAEWEWAARGGVGSNNFPYSGGNDANAVAWYYTNSGGVIQPVGTKAANELGIHDMSGNVYEWLWDLQDAEYTFRRIRGGSVDTNKESGRVDISGHASVPEYRSTDLSVGFRIVRSAP